MSLPDTITTDAVREQSHELNDMLNEEMLDRIDDPMQDYFDCLVGQLVVKFSLSEKQGEELADRLCWCLELLPPTAD